MSFSINTNVGALAALRSLGQTTQELGEVQSRIQTGFRVSTASDGASTFVIAQGLRGEVGQLRAVQEGIGFGQAALATAENAATEIRNRLNDLQEQFTAAQNEGLPTAPLQQEADSLIEEINSIVSSSSFSGINLLDGNRDGNFLIGTDGSTLTVASNNLSSLGLNLEGLQLRSADQIQEITFSQDAGNTAFGDGETLSLTRQDGSVVTFEFDDGGGTGVAAGNIAVDVGATPNGNEGLANLVTAINDQVGLTAVVSTDGDAANFGTADITAGDVTLNIEDSQGAVTLVDGTGVTNFGGSQVANGIDTVFSDSSALVQNGATLTLTRQDGTNVTFEVEDANVGDGVAAGNIAISVADLTAVTAADDVIDALQTALDAQGDFNAQLVAGDPDNAGGAPGFTIRFQENGGNTIANVATGNLAAGTASNTVRDPNNFSINSAAGTSIDSAIAQVDSVLSTLGTANNRLQAQADFSTLLEDSLEEGIGILVDADLAEESARLQSLQTQEQLGLQSLAIANQSSQSILSLFQ